MYYLNELMMDTRAQDSSMDHMAIEATSQQHQISWHHFLKGRISLLLQLFLK
jgi:hypothetical protein